MSACFTVLSISLATWDVSQLTATLLAITTKCFCVPCEDPTW
jgi:hypothetical protein